MRASSAALASFEISVAGRSAALARLQDVGIHAQTHGASRLAPFEPGIQKDAVQAFLLGGALDRLRAGHNHGAYFRIHVLPFGYSGRRAQIFDAGVGARSDEHAVYD